MNIFIETERVVLREIVLDDADALFELDSNPLVHRFLGNEPLVERQQAVDVIEFIRQQYADNGIGRWAMVDKSTSKFIGWAGLKYVTEITNGHSDYYDLGFRLMPEYWGKGIATEVARALLHYAFNNLKCDVVYSIVECGNGASCRVLEKVGFSVDETFILDGVEHFWCKKPRIEI